MLTLYIFLLIVSITLALPSGNGNSTVHGRSVHIDPLSNGFRIGSFRNVEGPGGDVITTAWKTTIRGFSDKLIMNSIFLRESHEDDSKAVYGFHIIFPRIFEYADNGTVNGHYDPGEPILRNHTIGANGWNFTTQPNIDGDIRHFCAREFMGPMKVCWKIAGRTFPVNATGGGILEITPDMMKFDVILNTTNSNFFQTNQSDAQLAIVAIVASGHAVSNNGSTDLEFGTNAKIDWLDSLEYKMANSTSVIRSMYRGTIENDPAGGNGLTAHNAYVKRIFFSINAYRPDGLIIWDPSITIVDSVVADDTNSNSASSFSFLVFIMIMISLLL